MELSKGKISDINVTFGFTTVGYLDTQGRPCAKTDYYLQAMDTGNGTISQEDWQKRMFAIEDNLLEKVLDARAKKVDIIEFLSFQIEIIDWLEKVRSILIQGPGTEPGQIMVEFKFPENTATQEKIPGLKLPSGMNTLTIEELETAFHKTIKAHDGEMFDGISQGHINLEDSLPWFEINFKGKSSTKKAKDFCQQLADEMNIRILFNRIQGGFESFSVFGVMDIDWELAREGCDAVPALSADGEWLEHMEDYGKPILPTHTKKKVKSKIKM